VLEGGVVGGTGGEWKDEAVNLMRRNWGSETWVAHQLEDELEVVSGVVFSDQSFYKKSRPPPSQIHFHVQLIIHVPFIYLAVSVIPERGALSSRCQIQRPTINPSQTYSVRAGRSSWGLAYMGLPIFLSSLDLWRGRSRSASSFSHPNLKSPLSSSSIFTTTFLESL
jgi:hypothetical protein